MSKPQKKPWDEECVEMLAKEGAYSSEEMEQLSDALSEIAMMLALDKAASGKHNIGPDQGAQIAQ